MNLGPVNDIGEPGTGEDEAPAEPRAGVNVRWSERLGRSLALPDRPLPARPPSILQPVQLLPSLPDE